MSDKKIRAIQKKAIGTITKFLRGIVREAKSVITHKKRKPKRSRKSRRGNKRARNTKRKPCPPKRGRKSRRGRKSKRR